MIRDALIRYLKHWRRQISRLLPIIGPFKPISPIQFVDEPTDYSEQFKAVREQMRIDGVREWGN